MHKGEIMVHLVIPATMFAITAIMGYYMLVLVQGILAL